MVKVLHVIGSMDPVSGGPCQGIRNTMKAAGQRITYREVVSLDDPGASFLGMDDFPVHAIGKGRGPWQYNGKLATWLTENLHRFDVVVINGLWLYTSYAVHKAVQRLRNQQNRKEQNQKVPRVFVMPHGMLDPYFQKAPERKLKALRNWLYWKLVEARVVNGADGVLFTCEEEMVLARQPFRPYRPKSEHNIGYGIKLPPSFTTSMQHAFHEKCEAVGGKPFLLFLSRIHPKKGVDTLINAYASLKEKKEVLALVIAGPGMDTAYGQKMKALVDRNGLGQNIYFPGMLTGDAKWGAFYGCEAFVLPSHQENFGIAVVEALACQKPVLISSQVNIWKDIWEEGGGLVAEDTLQGTKKILQEWLVKDRIEKAIMGEKALTAYQKKFNIDRVAERFLEAISY